MGQLVAPEDFNGLYEGKYHILPGRWNHVREPGMNGAMGVATFRSRLRLPDYNRDVAYHIIAPHASYRIYIDGVLAVSNGTVSETAEGFEPSYVSRTFKGESGDSEIVLQVANFSHAYGGAGHALTLWDAQRLRRFLDTLSVVYGLVLGVIFSIGFFHFILFLADRKDPLNGPIHFWFSILCFIIAYRLQGVIPLMHDYYPELNYWGSLRLPYASLYAAPAVYLLFFRSVFPEQFPKRLTLVIIGICLAGLVFTFFATEYAYTLTRNFSIFLNVFAIIYSILFTVRAMLDRQTGAAIILVTNFLFLLTAINDAIIYTDQGSGFDMTPFGILILGVGYSFALLLRLQRRFNKARETSSALETLNLELEKQVRDRTRAFKAAAAKAENAAEDRARFIAAASHDLRQPLHALAMFNAALKNKLRLKPEGALIDKQESAITNLGVLLQDTLDTARAEIQQKPVDFREVDLRSLLSKLEGSFAIKASERDVALAFEGEEGILTTDPVMLQRILGNLIDNALKAAKTTVSVTATQAANDWVFRVIDDGLGIANEDIANIFESYVTLEDTPSSESGGYGLGLYVVREFSRQLGGQMQVISNPEQGSEFKLTLPKGSLEIGLDKQDTVSEDMPKSLTGLRVLAIDDEAEILVAMRAMLESWGLSVKTASTLKKAQRIILGDFLPDVLIVDYHLGEVNGLDLIKELKTDLPASMSTIMITGATEPTILERIKAANIALLNKPVQPQLLAEAIKTVLSKN